MYVDDNGEWKLKEDKNLWHIIFRSIRKESRMNKLKDAIDKSLQQKNSLSFNEKKLKFMRFLSSKSKSMEKQLMLQARRSSIKKDRNDSLSNRKKKMPDSQNSFLESSVLF